MRSDVGFKGELGVRVIRGANSSLWRRVLDFFLRRTIK